MPWYFWLLLVIYFGVCIFLILVILLQAGKGGGISSLMGGGGGLGDQLGATSVERTLNKWTTVCAAMFGILAFSLALIGARHADEASILRQIEEPTIQQPQQTEAELEIPVTFPDEGAEAPDPPPLRLNNFFPPTQQSQDLSMKWLPLVATLMLSLSIGAGCGTSALKTSEASSQPAASQPAAVLSEGSGNSMPHTLSNGMKVLIHQTPGVGVATADVWVGTGSGNEPPELAGVSHFLEHMLFKGTERCGPGEMDHLVEGCECVLNAGTSKDFTHYYMTVPAERIGTAIDALGDALTSSTLNREEFEKERGVILEEILRKEDSPFGFLFEQVYQVAYSDGPYRHSVLGDASSIRAMTRDGMYGYYRHQYAPDNLLLVVAGDVNIDEVLAAAEQAFSPLETVEPAARNGRQPSTWNGGAAASFEKDVREIYSAVAFPAPGIDEVDDLLRADVLQALLSEGHASRLNRELKERRALVSSIGASFPTHRRDGLFVIFATLDPAQLEEYRQALMEELERAREKKFDRDAIKRAKKLMINGHHFAKETTGGAAGILGYYYTLTGSTDFEAGYVERVESVSASQVRDVARRIFDPTKAVWVTLVPPAASE